MPCTCDKPHTHNKVTDYALLIGAAIVGLLMLLLFGLIATNVHICSDEIAAVLTLARSPAATWQWLGLLLRGYVP
jgi:hypothetical protein